MDPKESDRASRSLPPETLARRIADLESRLADLDGQRAAISAELEELRASLPACPARDPGRARASSTSGRSTGEKVALFRRLFAGRTDVFPKYWHNTKTDRKGYSPACSNEWVRGVCDKPRVKCGECPNQTFIPVGDQVVLDHLRGRHVIGVYPMLEDESCRFLAVDFDKDGWNDDVAAFVETCRRFDLEVAVERSRSGNGAHAWLFFTAPVPAVTARQMGCFLLTETMARRPELSMASYDRLFPSQDTLPRGGFGNLIALPLQLQAREHGNTEFIDANFEPYTDQWGYLESLRRIDPLQVAALARRAADSGQIVGVPMASNEDHDAPWLRLPSRRRRAADIEGPLPSTTKVTLGAQVFLDKLGMPPALLNQVKRLAAFQNPEFYKKQSLRLSTALTPRVISCAEDLPGHIGLPRGCLDALRALLSDCSVELIVQDERTLGDPLAASFHGELTERQRDAADALTSNDIGVFVAPPGTGKTVVAAQVIAERGRSTLVLVHRTPLIEQWRAQLALFLGKDLKEVGQIGGGKRRPNGLLDVAMIQSLARTDEVDDLVAGYGHVVVDECHHVPAVSFERVLREVTARYVTGLTATPQRRDGHHPILDFQLGPIRYAIDPKTRALEHGFDHRLIIRETGFRLASEGNPSIQEFYGMLAADKGRNEQILNDVIEALAKGRSPVVLTERREHLEFLADQLAKMTRNLVVLQGGMGAKQRRAIAEKLASVADGEERLLLATGRFLGEGFDDARLDTLFLAMPVAWRGTLVQYAGRLHRKHADKAEVRIYDYVDRAVPMLARMFDKRMSGYRSMGYEVGEEVARGSGTTNEVTIEYDSGFVDRGID